MKLLNEGERLDADDLPPWMQTDEMRQAMSTLTAFSEKERAYHAYQARQNVLRQLRSIERELQKALDRAEAERKAKEAALAEIERLKVQLRDQ